MMSEETPLRVLVSDDHRLFRQGLINLMQTRTDLVEVVGEAGSGRETVRLTRLLRPDVVLMDIAMPDGNGLDATACIRSHYPDVAVVILTASESGEDLSRAIELGASGYLHKDLDAEQLFSTLSSIEAGETTITHEMMTQVLKNMAARSLEPDQGEEALTERERAVLCLIATGVTNQEIANCLSISINTVKSHIRSILDKLHLENRTQAASYAMSHGFVSRSTRTETPQRQRS